MSALWIGIIAALAALATAAALFVRWIFPKWLTAVLLERVTISQKGQRQ